VAELLEMVRQYGLPTALVLFFVWQNHVHQREQVGRERDLVTQIRTLENQVRKLLVATIRRNGLVIEALIEEMKSRPCMHGGLGVVEKLHDQGKDEDAFDANQG